MPEYIAPTQDMQFVIDEISGLESIARLPGFEDATPDEERFFTLCAHSAPIHETTASLVVARHGDNPCHGHCRTDRLLHDRSRDTSQCEREGGSSHGGED